MMALMPIDEALRQLLAQATTRGVETLPTEEALGRVLAHQVLAPKAYPFEDNSAMDGYAVLAGNGPWHVVGESAAGAPFEGSINADQAVRIFTGGVVPKGANTILIQENCERDGELVKTDQPLKAGRHIRRLGSDFEAGAHLIDQGVSLKGSDLSALVGLGLSEVTCHRRPRVAIFSTGDEVVPLGSKRQIGQVYDSNALFLRHAALQSGADIIKVGHLDDDRAQVDQALRHVIDHADLVLLSGGVSVGDHDHIGSALSDLCGGLTFYKVCMKPGKPVAAAQVGDCTLLGLPGNPASTMVSFELFARPMIKALSGAANPHRTLRLARGLKPLKAAGTRVEFLRATLCAEGLIPKARQGSGDLSSLLTVDALIYRPANAAETSAGDLQPYLALEGPDCGTAPEAQWDHLKSQV